ncbi:MAG: triose-phosphate isomerase [Bacteroidota bacterium]|nr:triose-phosphate isomerase [Bacteroidota bacterium]
MRTRLIAGNWKMNMDRHSGAVLLNELKGILTPDRIGQSVSVVVCPPFPLLGLAGDILGSTPLSIGAQNMHHEKGGAYTGEISADMLVSFGCRYVIVGHSERRRYFHETDEIVNRKALRALGSGLTPIICIGETLEEREAGSTMDIIERQVSGVLEGFDRAMLDRVILAYEPVWAIGTGKNATPAQAQEVHRFVRDLLDERYSPEAGEGVTILYGGSMKAENAYDLLSEPDIDGGLVGGASLDARQFTGIVDAACRAREHQG